MMDLWSSIRRQRGGGGNPSTLPGVTLTLSPLIPTRRARDGRQNREQPSITQAGVWPDGGEGPNKTGPTHLLPVAGSRKPLLHFR